MAAGDVTTELIGTTFRLTLIAPCTLRIHPEYEAMVWNECLRSAHSQGYIPVSPVWITDADLPQQESLQEGQSLVVHRPGGLDVQPAMMRVTAEVEIQPGLVLPE